jgi:hypothetical protein
VEEIMATTKIFSEVAIQEQIGATYEEDNMVKLPYTTNSFLQKRDTIEDESFQGVAFKDTPQRGANATAGSISCNVDIVSLAAYLKTITGYETGGVYSFLESTANTSKLSLARKDSVSYKKYANVYPKSLKISGAPGGIITANLDLIGVTPEVRAALSGWPTTENVAEPFTFHEMSGSGYFRVGDQVDALAAGDNLKIEEFSFDIITGYDSQQYNAYEILTPEMGQVPPSIEGSFKISTHDVDTFIDFRDNMTKLQLSLLLYKTATNQLSIVIPNFIIDTELTDDELVRQGITMKIGRNGVGTSYVNSNYSFTSPIKITIVNS